jgi:hypothetical protein
VSASRRSSIKRASQCRSRRGAAPARPLAQRPARKAKLGS